MVYDDTHRFVLSLISSQSVLSLKHAKRILESHTGSQATNLQEIIKEINEKIKPFQQMIKIVKDEVTSQQLVIFLSLGDDKATRAQNLFSPLELEFFRVLIDNIMSTETREISEISAINLVNNIKVNNRLLSKIDAEKVLQTWCRMRYLDKEENTYALGVRAIHEFETYFCRNMADIIEKCSICKEIVFRGYNCPVCAKPIHIRCLEACLGKVQKWPCCKSDYVHSQLESLRGQSSRLTQRLEATQVIESQDTTAEETQNTTAESHNNTAEASQVDDNVMGVHEVDMNATADSSANTSQRRLKRKRGQFV